MPTIKDVAKAAGVSVAMVSKALNNYPDVSPKTREKVLKIADEMSYTPNVVARNLSSKKQKTIAMITSGFLNSESLDNSNSFDLFKGVYTATEEDEYELAIYLTDTHKQHQKDYAKFCRDRNIRGVVLSGIRLDDPYFEDLLKTKIPCVLIDVKIDKEKNKLLGSVMTDNVQASYDITQHVISHNHKHIAIVAGDKEADVSRERMKGVRKAFEENGLRLDRTQIINGDYKEEVAYKSVKRYMKQTKDIPTAIISFSDIMALGTLNALKDLNYNVPEDISITGFDGLSITKYVDPSITTVKQSFKELGFEAAKLVQDIMEGESEEREKIVPHKLLEHDSVKRI